MAKRIKRLLAGLAVSGALAGGAVAGTAVTATPASASPISFFFFHSPCAPHGHEMLFCEGTDIASDVALKENIVPVVW